MILSFKSIGSSWGKSYNNFFILVDIKLRFTCGESDLLLNIVQKAVFQNIVNRITWKFFLWKKHSFGSNKLVL